MKKVLIMKYCRSCVMPDTKPGLTLDSAGVCSACRSNEKKKGINWNDRNLELKTLGDSIRGTNGNGYECIIPVSGGKDSIYQTWMMAKVHKLKTLAVCMAPHVPTREGIANLNSLVESLNVDLIKVTVKPEAFRTIRQKCFYQKGEPNWAEHLIIFSGVARVALMYHVPLIVWGEDIAAEFGGTGGDRRIASAENIVKNDLIKDSKIAMFYDDKIQERDTYFYQHPDIAELKRRNVRSIYLGFYDWWDGYKNFLKAQELGFQSRREGNLSGNFINYDNIDEKLCEINIWFKFLKFGFWRPTDQACYRIWNGKMTRKEGVELVNNLQYEFPKEYLHEFLEFHRVSLVKFWETVDKYRNKEIWHKVKGEWRLKESLV